MDKVDVLLDEAEKDIKVGCYNKAVSASYFAVSMEIEKLGYKLRTTIPRRDDKLINILMHLGKDSLAKEAMYLYKKRKDADYGYESLKEEDAMKCLEISKRLVQEIGKIIRGYESSSTPSHKQ
ncbi:HEPN domain-containing protein [Acidianus sp. HS-5]|uniref:HEPN domain-containing protein n=1 Tax=Acidianus sp. HS-5 TaxID=2886040 RepID=UPI001F3FCDA0|nr:HEPN domain-containing protein [Acidianus sp. HS-5]BDC17986.1 HEPN domain-containing protein [Acidianus sp. HS-5]